MSIQVSSVSKRYGAQLALDQVTFSLRKGEIVGFLGPNGAGKSTMMKIITGYIPPSSGEVVVCGHRVSAESIDSRRRIGYLPELNPLYTDMYVREYLSFTAGLYGLRSSSGRVEEMIDLVGLAPEAHKKIEALSKGYRQRVGLAQAMIHDPEVLILDEPTSGLDPNQLAEIRELISTIGREKTVMLSTHIMQEVEAICSRAIIINRGKLVADQPTSNLRHYAEKGAHQVEVEFSAEVTESALSRIDGVVKITALGPGRWLLDVRGQRDVRRDLPALAQQLGVDIITLHRREQRLEEVFKELTRPDDRQAPRNRS